MIYKMLKNKNLNKYNMLQKISDTQKIIIESLKDNNVIVESVAGSGKTTTSLYIAKYFNNKKILLLTYSSKLKIDTQEKIKKNKIINMDAYSYHSFCVKYYNNNSYTDEGINQTIKINMNPIIKFNYDIIILDELQDMTQVYYEFICKINRDNTQKAIFCLLGDRYQSIYDFNGADSRYLIYADKLFKFNELQWKTHTLHQSYRITNKMAQFINVCMMKKEHIISQKTGLIPKYIICNPYCNDTYNSPIIIQLKQYLDDGFLPEDIFILAPSIKSVNTPVRNFENLIKNKLNINIYVPSSDEEKIDPDILKNKLVFSTFHQSKGLERKIVFVFSFDESYFKFYKKDKNPNECPNELYVAVTRASEHLILIHDSKKEYLPFVDKSKICEYCDVNGLLLQCNNFNKKSNYNTSVSDVIKNISPNILDNCMQYITIIKKKDASNYIDIPLKIKENHGYENVSEITGTAIPAYFQYKMSGIMKIYEDIKNGNMMKKKYNNSDFIYDSDANDEFIDTDKNNLNHIDLKNLTIDNLLYISNLYCSMISGYIYKTMQIKKYNWLSDEKLNNTIENLKKINISNNAIFEEKIEIENKNELINRRLIGYIDCIDNNNIYEFKCVKQLENIHILQLAIYMYIKETHIYDKYIVQNEINKQNILDFELQIKKNNEKITKLKQLKRINDIKEKNKEIELKKTELFNNLNKPHIILNNYYLYNILSDEMIQITCLYENLKEMIAYLINSKYYSKINITDDKFIDQSLNIFNKWINQKDEEQSKIIHKNILNDISIQHRVSTLKMSDIYKIINIKDNLINISKNRKKKYTPEECKYMKEQINTLEYLIKSFDNNESINIDKIKESITIIESFFEKNKIIFLLKKCDKCEKKILSCISESTSFFETNCNICRQLYKYDVLNNCLPKKITYDEIQNDDNVMIFDIETTGYNNGNILIQLSYIICDSNLKIINNYNYYCKYDELYLDFYNKTKVFDIINEGYEITDILSKFSYDMSRCNKIVGHNIKGYDIPSMKKIFDRHNVKYTFPINIDDTLYIFRRRYKQKNNKLVDMCKFLLNDIPTDDNYHTADYDTMMTYKCYLELQKTIDVDKNIKSTKNILDYCIDNNVHTPNEQEEKTTNKKNIEKHTNKQDMIIKIEIETTSVKKFLIHRYKRISVNTINKIGNDEFITMNEIQIFCQKYNIKMVVYDINKNIIFDFYPTKINKNYGALIFTIDNNQIY
jgi:hypothetical protein